MKRASASLLKTAVILIAVGALAFLLLEPHVEGRNVGASLFNIYFTDPFLAYAYLASIPFFVSLYQLFKLSGDAGRNELPNQRSVKALQTIKYCAMVTVILIVIGVAWLLSVESDDRPPVVAMGTVTAFLSIAGAAIAAVFEKKARRAVERKSGT